MLLRLRFALDLYINLRPFHRVPRPGRRCDFVVIVGETPGDYAGEGGFLRKAPVRGGDPGLGSTRATA